MIHPSFPNSSTPTDLTLLKHKKAGKHFGYILSKYNFARTFRESVETLEKNKLKYSLLIRNQMKELKISKLLYALLLVVTSSLLVNCVDDNDDTEAPFFEVAPTTLNFDLTGQPVGSDASFTINTNRAWSITMPKELENWLVLSQESGNGPAKVTITVPESATPLTTNITVQFSNKVGVLRSQVITINCGEIVPSEVIYNETFGTTALTSPYPLVADYADWVTTGTGASEVTYSGTNTSVRASLPNNNTSYSGASGPNLIFFGAAPGEFVVNKIALTAAQTNLRLTFGGQHQVNYDTKDYTFDPAKFEVYLSGDGTAWTPVTYDISGDYTVNPNWILGTADFTLKQASAYLYVKFRALDASNTRLDDITLATGNGGQEVNLEGGVTPPEPPTTDAIYYEPVGTAEVSGNTAINDYTGWAKSGSGAANVTYSGTGPTVRNSSPNTSSSYDGASGAPIIFFGTAPSEFIISNIALTAEQTKLRLTFGGQHQVTYQTDYTFESDQFTVALSADGTNWSAPITYNTAGDVATKPNWILATADFTLKEAASSLYIKFNLLDTHNTRIDDIKLTVGEGGQEVDLSGNVTPPTGETTAITIPELIAKMTTSSVPVDASYTVTGIVCGDPAGLNYSNGTLYIMTKGATTAGNGLVLYNSQIDMAAGYALGDEVKVTLTKEVAALQIRNGVPQATGFAAADIEKLSTGNAVTPVTIQLSDLASFVSMPVTIENVTAPAADTWKDGAAMKNHTFNVSGTDFTININARATPFEGQPYAATTASITGIASIYQSAGQLMPRNLSDVAAFAFTEPMITGLTPATYTFSAEGGTHNFTATVVNQGATPITVSGLSAPLSAEVDGTTIIVTAVANTGEAISQEMVVTLGSTSKTATVNVDGASAGNGTTVSVDLTNASNYPEGFPASSSAKLVEPTAYTIGGYEFVIAGSTGNGFYQATSSGTAYLLIGKAGAYIELPAVSGKKLTKIVATGRNGASTSVMIGVVDTSDAEVSGGTPIKWDNTAGYEYTYNLSGTSVDAKYRIKVNSAHNAQFTNLVLTYE
ncbi:MAG: DUF5689 domain-containing protein [Mediterranea sp.]|jgi:hypothetical protein|nr:DUF5689 domain-containing protein [Mediterranea sp.]